MQQLAGMMGGQAFNPAQNSYLSALHLQQQLQQAAGARLMMNGGQQNGQQQAANALQFNSAALLAQLGQARLQDIMGQGPQQRQG